MALTLGFLLVAATFEIGGLAAMRRGLAGAPAWLGLGLALLAAYGLVVNTDRAVAFGRLMGTYIAVFFLVSQALSAIVFGERPSVGLIFGGSMIVAGGLLIQLTGR
jgi:drug/metabolite transporter superfamily protein YnfA